MIILIYFVWPQVTFRNVPVYITYLIHNFSTAQSFLRKTPVDSRAIYKQKKLYNNYNYTVIPMVNLNCPVNLLFYLQIFFFLTVKRTLQRKPVKNMNSIQNLYFIFKNIIVSLNTTLNQISSLIL